MNFASPDPVGVCREIYQKSNRINRNSLVINGANAALIQGDFNFDKTASVSGMHFQVFLPSQIPH